MYFKVIEVEENIIVFPINLISSDWYIKQIRLRNPDLKITKYNYINDSWKNLYDYIVKFSEDNSGNCDVYTTFDQEVFGKKLLHPCGFLYTLKEKRKFTDNGLDIPDSDKEKILGS